MRTIPCLILGVATTMLACSQTLPPSELIDARAAYGKAAVGPAAKLDPAALQGAAEELALAEKQFKDDGDTFRTRSTAYTAERKSELADTLARTMAANGQASSAAQKLELTQATVLQNVRSQLSQTREQLAAATAAMAQLSAMKQVNVKQEERGTVITLSGSVLFASAKYELLGSAQETLTNVATALSKSDASSRIIVQGYTDSQGSLSYNETLSKNRAESVRAFLTSHGVPSDRVTSIGYGPANPVAGNDSPEGRANNRRVEIVVTPPNAPATDTAVPSSTHTTSTTTVH